jgi:hypothetical protein
MELKHCPKCDRDLPKEKFSKNVKLKDGLCCWCKECSHNNYANNKEKRAKAQKEYREKNREVILKKKAEYTKRTKEKKAQYDKEYYQNNKQRKIEYQKQYFEKNKDLVYEKNKKYNDARKDKISEYKVNYDREKRKTDQLYKFKKQIRHLVWLSFKRKNINKNNLVCEILGCSEEEAQRYLYKTFFDNYGYEYDGRESVHIDHIIPLATAKTEEDVKRLCHYTNLQLLKPMDNLSKGAKC